MPAFEFQMKNLPVAIVVLMLLCVSSLIGQDAVQKPTGGLSYGFVVDNSGSYRMVLERVIKLVSSVAEKNITGDEAFLLTFVDPAKTKIRQELTGDKSEIRDAADNMYVEGGQTSLLDAVRLSIDYLSANTKEKGVRNLALLLISDGDDMASSAKIETVLAAANDAKIRIVVVGISDEKVNTKLLDRLAKGTGGTAFYPRSLSDTDSITNGVASALRAK